MPWKYHLPNRLRRMISGAGCAATSKAAYVPDILEMEDRVMYSATPIDLVGLAEAIDAGSSPESFDSLVEVAEDSLLLDTSIESNVDLNDAALDSADEQEDLPASPLDELPIRHELVFIDSSIANLDELIADMQSDASRTLEFVVLDSQQDGIAQITSVLLQHEDVDAIHVVSHGAHGQVSLGSTTLSLGNLNTYLAEIDTWQQSMSADADLLFYGCNLAATADGRELMNKIGAECDCDVAASDDLTGHVLFNADWDLEYQIGVVEAENAFSFEIQSNWLGLLATLVVDTTSDENDGNTSSVANLIATPGGSGISLREAIIAANNTAGDDTITLSAGTYTLSISGNDDLSASGDLDILSNITISGAGISLTTIDANSLDRVVDVVSGTLNLTDLQITGGIQASGDGGGIDIANGATLNLARVDVSSNSAINGGGVNNLGAFTVVDSLIHSNTASADGGGVRSVNGAVTLTNVSLVNNDAASGGGIHLSGASSTTTLSNVTVSGSTVFNDGGGIVIASAGTVNLNYVTVSNNHSTTGSGAGLYAASTTVNVLGSIFANNTAGALSNPSDIYGTINSQGYNVIESTVGVAGLSGFDITGVDPGLAALAIDATSGQYVHAINTSSNAHDAGGGSPPATDIRGVARDVNPDIGSFELEPNRAPTDIVIDYDSPIVHPQTNDIVVNTTNAGDQSVPEVDELSNGNKIIVWQAANVDGSGRAVVARIVDNTGNPLVSEFQINSTNSNDQDTPDVTALSGGGLCCCLGVGRAGWKR